MDIIEEEAKKEKLSKREQYKRNLEKTTLVKRRQSTKEELKKAVLKQQKRENARKDISELKTDEEYRQALKFVPCNGEVLDEEAGIIDGYDFENEMTLEALLTRIEELSNILQNEQLSVGEYLARYKEGLQYIKKAKEYVRNYQIILTKVRADREKNERNNSKKHKKD